MRPSASLSYQGNRRMRYRWEASGFGGLSSCLPHRTFHRSHEPFPIVAGGAKGGQSPELTPSGVSGARKWQRADLRGRDTRQGCSLPHIPLGCPSRRSKCKRKILVVGGSLNDDSLWKISSEIKTRLFPRMAGWGWGALTGAG